MASATPILDLEQDPPRSSKPWLPKLIGIALGLCIVGLMILADQGRLPPWHWPGFNGLLLIPAIYVVIAIHEFGHLVAGRLAGIDAGGIAIGAFIATKSAKGWVWQFDRRRWAGGFFKPLTPAVDIGPARYAWMVAGGPLASILFAAVCAAGFNRFGSGAWDWIGTLFWTALFLALCLLIPISDGVNMPDGPRLWQLIRHAGRWQTWAALLALQTEDAGGIRPRAWNNELFEQVVQADVSSKEYLACQMLGYYRRSDEGLEAAAVEHLEKALARSKGIRRDLQQSIFLEAAWASAIVRKDGAQARTWLDRATRLQKPKSVDAVAAAIAMCEGRDDEAAKHWAAARVYAEKKKLDSGLMRAAQEKWAMLDAVCRPNQNT